ncbi:DUF6083 domain-containing protein [Streptomyces sp. NBC_01788]|uniref:DUF6083 domain-containing protein n=1 Tax=Streptomyces sp. NBC_01788 TaxID=2975940 RepID=UPI002DDBBC6A|nr:DUF6083 domain-containing protein [Streptomyces sp. NBC_01788]WSB24494.1 DUF6083 domain-containing protein [Streptomyces sp. NBC_01788]WSB30954.1 DUF6083 domain-containing protein [Streptomyces sp. NBC_01788]
MHSHPLPADRHWDGSPRRVSRRRGLQIAPASRSRLLRAGQSGRCRHCGNRVDWYPRHDDRPIALHPADVAVVGTPASCRWHIGGGIAHPHDDGSAWCRIPHAVLCPQQPLRSHIGHTRLTSLRRDLAVHSRRLIDTGAFTPQPCPQAPAAAPAGEAGQPIRPVVRILLVPYLGRSPLEDIRCVAQTRQRRRCTLTVLAPGHLAGRWRLLPTGPHHGQLALPGTTMAVYDLSHLPYTHQLRWRAQHCPAHATGTAPDLTLADWQVFDPLLHAAHIRTRLPHIPARGLGGR